MKQAIRQNAFQVSYCSVFPTLFRGITRRLDLEEVAFNQEADTVKHKTNIAGGQSKSGSQFRCIYYYTLPEGSLGNYIRNCSQNLIY